MISADPLSFLNRALREYSTRLFHPITSMFQKHRREVSIDFSAAGSGLFSLSEGMVLYLALSPVRKKLAHIKWAVGKFGDGELGIRVQTAKRGDLIDSIGDTFNFMALRLESLVGTHKELLGIVAHELRTPLARIRIALELIKESPTGDPGVIDKIIRMEKDIADLDLIISELLDFNRLSQQNDVVWENIDMADLCMEIFDAETWERDGIATGVTGSASYEGDRKLMARALGNIIRNAVKHTSSRIDVHLLEQGACLEIIIADDGTGFDPALSDKLGTPFLKDQSSSGVGLGLAIALRITELHGGSISFGTSSELGGAEVVVELGT